MWPDTGLDEWEMMRNPSKSARRPVMVRMSWCLILCFAVLLGGLAMSSASVAMGAKENTKATGQQMPRPVVALLCPQPQTKISQALCHAVHQHLQQAAPRSVVRRGPDLEANPETVPAIPGSLLVKLSLGAQSPIALPARLRWKTKTSGGWETGPEVTLSVSDAELSAAMMIHLARDLVKISALPLPGAKPGPKSSPEPKG